MAFIKCPECNEQVLADELICKNCGYPLKRKGIKFFLEVKFNLKRILIIGCIVSLLLIGTICCCCVSKNDFSDRLVSNSSWTETKYGYNISFSKDGIFKYHQFP